MKSQPYVYLKSVIVLMTAFWLLSCSNDSPKMVTPTLSHQQKTSDSLDKSGTFDAAPVQVDVLLVIANDSSMAEHEANLTANAAQFTSQFFKNKVVDFHVGVINAMASNQNLGPVWGGRLSGTPKFIDSSTQDCRRGRGSRYRIGALRTGPSLS